MKNGSPFLDKPKGRTSDLSRNGSAAAYLVKYEQSFSEAYEKRGVPQNRIGLCRQNKEEESAVGDEREGGTKVVNIFKSKFWAVLHEVDRKPNFTPLIDPCEQEIAFVRGLCRALHMSFTDLMFGALEFLSRSFCSL